MKSHYVHVRSRPSLTQSVEGLYSPVFFLKETYTFQLVRLKNQAFFVPQTFLRKRRSNGADKSPRRRLAVVAKLSSAKYLYEASRSFIVGDAVCLLGDYDPVAQKGRLERDRQR